MLAEKYLDFEILMRICEANNNEDRINEYMRRFKDTDFSEFVYNWYMREGKQSKLLIRLVIFLGYEHSGATGKKERRAKQQKLTYNFLFYAWLSALRSALLVAPLCSYP